MKEDTKKTDPKSKIKIKDIAPKKDAKGGVSSRSAISENASFRPNSIARQ